MPSPGSEGGVLKSTLTTSDDLIGNSVDLTHNKLKGRALEAAHGAMTDQSNISYTKSVLDACSTKLNS